MAACVCVGMGNCVYIFFKNFWFFRNTGKGKAPKLYTGRSLALYPASLRLLDYQFHHFLGRQTKILLVMEKVDITSCIFWI